MYDIKNGYPTKLREFLNILYPRCQINIIDSGLSGDWASNGYKRLERDVLQYHPDLCIISFMLNDSCALGIEHLNEYIEALNNIFNKLKDNVLKLSF